MYPRDFLVRVTAGGMLPWAATQTCLPGLLAREAIGSEEIDDGVAQLWFDPICLGLLRRAGKNEVQFVENRR